MFVFIIFVFQLPSVQSIDPHVKVCSLFSLFLFSISLLLSFFLDGIGSPVLSSWSFKYCGRSENFLLHILSFSYVMFFFPGEGWNGIIRPNQFSFFESALSRLLSELRCDSGTFFIFYVIFCV